jgi:hypothetical protein
MGKGLGIAGLVISIIAIFIPIGGIFIGWAALLFVTVAAIAGEVTLTIAVVAISAVDYLFCSPWLWIATAGAHFNENISSPNLLLWSTGIMIVAPIVGLIARRIGVFGGR